MASNNEIGNIRNENDKLMQMSDYSFLERSVHEVYIWIWFLLHVWRCDGFSALRFKHIISFELKSFVTIFILFALPLESFYDIVSTKIKYVEGLYLFPGADEVMRAKPRWLWSEEHQLWILPSYYILMVGIGFQMIILYLLQCFWNYLVNSIAQTPFMSREEFSFHIVWGVICVGSFPVLPYVFKNNDVLLETIPQVVYAAQLFILTLLGVRTHQKFRRLIETISTYKNSSNIIAKIRYFIDMNKLLTSALAIMSAAFCILGIDKFTTAKVINNSKLASDLLIAHVNFASVVEWIVLILIFYPRKGFVGTDAGGTSFNTNTNMGLSSVNTSQVTTATKFSTLTSGTAGIGVNMNVIRHSQTNSVSSSHNFGYEDKQQIYNKPPTFNNEPSQPPTLQKQSSLKRLKKKSLSKKSISSVPSNNNSATDLDNYSDNNMEEIIKAPVPLLKRNISISKDGKMLYGETKPLGRVKGAEFVAVEKADPSIMPSYYFMGEFTDRDGNVHKVPPSLNGIDRGGVGGRNSSNVTPQQGIQGNNDHNVDNEEDDEEEFFYAM
ncbi:15599_t:CDS:2 [Funneliformis mosseae]|uniref:15599_t:CDS:1 n=1 Tax=Funneliformis mosseae TaxID=27381 RepID=A0A9N9BZQ7_FUNMO|nr:15599_t:CDS:2 [Funneliformis mosseae]